MRVEVNRRDGMGLGSLFHHPEFHRMHAGEEGLYLEAFDAARPCLVLSAAPAGEGHWRSPLRGTYGAYAVASGVDLGAWREVHAHAEDWLRRRGARSLELHLAPQAHDPEAVARQAWLLQSLGYTVVRTDLNYATNVTGAAFDSRVDADHRRRLHKAWRNGLAAEPVVPAQLPQLHALLASAYAERGRHVTMSVADLQAMAEHFPQALVLLACTQADTRVGAAIALRVSPHVLYLYAWSAAVGHRASDATTVMAERLYRLCQDEGRRLLDGGTATVGGVLDTGLARFKQALGMTASLKLRLAKPLESSHA